MWVYSSGLRGLFAKQLDTIVCVGSNPTIHAKPLVSRCSAEWVKQ